MRTLGVAAFFLFCGAFLNAFAEQQGILPFLPYKQRIQFQNERWVSAEIEFQWHTSDRFAESMLKKRAVEFCLQKNLGWKVRFQYVSVSERFRYFLWVCPEPEVCGWKEVHTDVGSIWHHLKVARGLFICTNPRL